MQVKMTKQDIAEMHIEDNKKTFKFFKLKLALTLVLGIAGFLILVAMENEMWPFAIFLNMLLLCLLGMETEMEYSRNQNLVKLRLSLYSGRDKE